MNQDRCRLEFRPEIDSWAEESQIPRLSADEVQACYERAEKFLLERRDQLLVPRVNSTGDDGDEFEDEFEDIT